MDPASHQQTLFVPKPRATSVVDRATTGLPPDLLNRAANRLQILAWLYAFTFFMADFFPSLLFPPVRAVLLERAVNWAPGFISIVVAVSVALIIRAAGRGPGRSWLSHWCSKWPAATVSRLPSSSTSS
jgi:hypothetical protein